jgi:hypothetical protein
MQKLWGIALLFAGLSATQNAHADEGDYNYFSQPTVTRTQVLADYEECRELAGAVQPPPAGYVYSQGVAGAAAAGFMKGLIEGAQRRHMGDAAIRKCMSIKGYTRYKISKDEAKALYAGKWEAMRERLADRAIAPLDPTSVRLDP